jgi:hypothetical protein
MRVEIFKPSPSVIKYPEIAIIKRDRAQQSEIEMRFCGHADICRE